jgi:hypothetical protein
VLYLLFRMAVELGSEAVWMVFFFAAVVAVFVVYLGIAMRETLRERNPEQQQVRYQIFRDLLELFRRGERR